MNFLSMVPGSFTLELTSADPEDTLETLISSGIAMSGIHKKSELTFQCRISRKDYDQLVAICDVEDSAFHAQVFD